MFSEWLSNFMFWKNKEMPKEDPDAEIIDNYFYNGTRQTPLTESEILERGKLFEECIKGRYEHIGDVAKEVDILSYEYRMYNFLKEQFRKEEWLEKHRESIENQLNSMSILDLILIKREFSNPTGDDVYVSMIIHEVYRKRIGL